jgi:hypothetical protein
MMADATHHRFMDVIMTRAPETDFVASRGLNVLHSKYQQSNDHLNCAGATPETLRRCPQIGIATPQFSLAEVFLRPRCPALLPPSLKRRQHQGEYPNARSFRGHHRGPSGHCVAGEQCGAANELPTASNP